MQDTIYDYLINNATDGEYTDKRQGSMKHLHPISSPLALRNPIMLTALCS